MKYAFALFVCVSMIAWLAMSGGHANVEAHAAVSLTDSYVLTATGTDATCVVRRNAGQNDQLAVERTCDRILPGLSKVDRWLDLDDGSVAFTTDAGDEVVRFAIADGAAYESFKPRTPVVSLFVPQ